jgi:putative oxidoreductase
MWNSLSRYRDGALLFLRVALGLFFIYAHGWPKLAGGVGAWKKYGNAMKHVGIDFWPEFWGFMAAFSESIGAGFIVLGLFFRPSCMLILLTMTVASAMQSQTGDLIKASHPIEMAIVFFSLIFIGPGKYSIDKG